MVNPTNAYAIMPGLIQRFVWPFTRLLFPIFLRLNVAGFEHVKALKGNFIIASNHSSELDPVLIATCMPFFSRSLPLFFVGRQKSFYSDLGLKGKIYGGIFFDMLGVFPAYTGLNDYKKALRHHLEILADNRSVCIFPSGKRNLGGEKAQPRPGVAFLAHETGLPVIPVRIQGLEGTSLKKFFSRTKTVKITFGSPIYARDLPADYQAGADMIMQKIEGLE